MTDTPQPNAVIGTGLSGLVGSKVVELLSTSYEFENIDLAHPVKPTDITKPEQVMATMESSPAPVVLHFAAFTDVTKSWEQTDDKNGLAYQVNVVGTKNMAEAAKKTGKHLVHISTSYVFNGEKEEMYVEEDPLSPIEWYGRTKAWAEEAVQESGASYTILRIDQPFRSDSFNRPDVVRRIANGLQNGTLPPQFTNHWIGPTYIDDFAKVVQFVIESKTQGILNASSGEKWTDFDLANAIQEILKVPGEVKEGDLDAYLAKSNRPYQRNTSMSTEKLRRLLPEPLLTVREAIARVQLDAAANQ